MKTALIVSPNWHDYASKYLEEFLASIVLQSVLPDKVFLIDNESSEESFTFLKVKAEFFLSDKLDWEIIVNHKNLGFAGGNNVALKKCLAEEFDYALLFNMDGFLDKDAVRLLVQKINDNDSLGAVQARIMLWPDQELINSLGNSTHFLGFGFCDAYKKRWQETDLAKLDNKEIFYPSGAAVIVRLSLLAKIGLFDEKYWMYNEDQDLGWRIWLSGFKVVLAPEAVFYHEYEFSRSIKKYYWMDRNRLISVFIHYKLATLLLILPSLILMEFGQLLFAWRGDWLKEKLKVYGWFFSVNNLKYLASARKKSLNLRVIPDKDLLRLISGTISYQEIDSLALRIANLFFNTYWKIVSQLIVW